MQVRQRQAGESRLAAAHTVSGLCGPRTMPAKATGPVSVSYNNRAMPAVAGYCSVRSLSMIASQCSFYVLTGGKKVCVAAMAAPMGQVMHQNEAGGVLGQECRAYDSRMHDGCCELL